MSTNDKVTYLSNAALAIGWSRFLTNNTGLVNGKGDAFRHGLFSLLNTQSFGATVAENMGDLHENRPNNPQIENDMDQHNNAQGRNAYNSSSLVPRPKIIYDLMKNGSLKYIKNNTLTPTNQ